MLSLVNVPNVELKDEELINNLDKYMTVYQQGGRGPSGSGESNLCLFLTVARSDAVCKLLPKKNQDLAQNALALKNALCTEVTKRIVKMQKELKESGADDSEIKNSTIQWVELRNDLCVKGAPNDIRVLNLLSLLTGKTFIILNTYNSLPGSGGPKKGTINLSSSDLLEPNPELKHNLLKSMLTHYHDNPNDAFKWSNPDSPAYFVAFYGAHFQAVEPKPAYFGR
tara:strand:+ start:31 stop:705 length:675 start_codon:yes stop_codon:yes gene_type:complete